jgi:hypothetical protein
MPSTVGTDPHASAPLRVNGFGITSLVLGFIGLALFFLAPLGAVISAGGVITGLLGWLLPGMRARGGLGLAIAGTLLSVAALAFDIFLLEGGITHVWANRY